MILALAPCFSINLERVCPASCIETKSGLLLVGEHLGRSQGVVSQHSN
jgi:hypothetical protein